MTAPRPLFMLLAFLLAVSFTLPCAAQAEGTPVSKDELPALDPTPVATDSSSTPTAPGVVMTEEELRSAEKLKLEAEEMERKKQEAAKVPLTPKEQAELERREAEEKAKPQSLDAGGGTP